MSWIPVVDIPEIVILSGKNMQPFEESSAKPTRGAFREFFERLGF